MVLKHLRDAAPPRKESEIVREILTYLRTVPGVTAWRCNVGASSGAYKGKAWFVRFGFAGLSDIIGWRSEWVAANRQWRLARFLAIEVKRPGQKLTSAQLGFLTGVRNAGGIGILAHSLDEVRAVLEDQG